MALVFSQYVLNSFFFSFFTHIFFSINLILKYLPDQLFQKNIPYYDYSILVKAAKLHYDHQQQKCYKDIITKLGRFIEHEKLQISTDI